MDLYLTRLPLLGGLILRTSSSDGLGGLPVRRPEGFVGIKFPALVVLGVLLAAVGAFLSRLTRCLGWVEDGRRSSRCLCGGKSFSNIIIIVFICSAFCAWSTFATSAITMA